MPLVAQDDSTAGLQNITTVERQFVTPPDDARIMMRWWWFGAAVVKPELRREILAMKAGGIGGFEIQPVYPMALDDDAKGIHNLPYLSAGFLDAVSYAAGTGREQGMRVDLTLGSGWPYGGSYVAVQNAAAKLRVAAMDVPGGAATIAMPVLRDGESLITAFAGEGSAKQYDPSKLRQVAVAQVDGRLSVPAGKPQVIVFFISSRTGMKVKRPSVGADGFVLDHLSEEAVADHLRVAGEPLMKAFGSHPPYAVFSDSLEDYGQDWTPDFLAQFQRRRGYDLTPHLAEMVAGTDEASAGLRHDWGVTLTELMDERYLAQIDGWAKAHHTRFRSQTYGDPAVSLSSNRFTQLIEGEGPEWNDFSYARIATSASHLYGRPITSAETWTWLDAPPFRANPLDMKMVADRFFLEGVNLLIGHGWPYTPPGVPEPGWSLYAAAVFDDHNPWWIVMPDVTRYLQRMSYVLRQGSPANDVALLLPNDDAYSEFTLGKVSLSDALPKWIKPEIVRQIEAAGHNFDFIDAEAIHALGIPYPVLVMPHVERLSPQTLEELTAYVQHGGKVIAIGSKPERAPGYLDARPVSADVKRLSGALFSLKNVSVVAKDADLAATLEQMVEPDVRFSSGSSELGFIHRKLKDADAYFVVNSTNHPVETSATFRSPRRAVSWWDPLSGRRTALPSGPVVMDLAPYESRVVVFSESSIGRPEFVPGKTTKLLADLSHDWKVTFPSSANLSQPTETFKYLTSWTNDAKTRFFSGVVTYTKTIHLRPEDLRGATSIILDFGKGTPAEPDQSMRYGQRALLDGPVREAAVVSIDGLRVGSVWHPPYTLDVLSALHDGDNVIEIRVANTALNVIAGRPAPDYRALNARYGKRFEPWDSDKTHELPSGLIGQIHLLETK